MTERSSLQDALRATRVLVIGGSSGIGLATAEMAAQRGARVTIASRHAARLAAALKSLPAGIESAALDAANAGAVEAFFEHQPPWDHVVVTAADTRSASAAALPLADARASMDSKFWGAYHVGRSARIAPGGSLTLCSGVYAQRPQREAVLQGAINAALEALARGLALERAPDVRVNTVSPSTTDTPLWDRLGVPGREAKLAAMRRQMPLQRIPAAEHVAHAIVFLATNPSATGSTVRVDGGDAVA